MTKEELQNLIYNKVFPNSSYRGTSINTPIILNKESPSDYIASEYAINLLKNYLKAHGKKLGNLSRSIMVGV